MNTLSTGKRYRFTLMHQTAREMAVTAVRHAPDGWHVEVKAPTRSLEQSALLHARLDDIAQQVVWHGQKLSAHDWKRMFAASLQGGVRVVPGIDNGTFIPIGLRTREITATEMADMIALAEAFGAERGVEFKASSNLKALK